MWLYRMYNLHKNLAVGPNGIVLGQTARVPPSRLNTSRVKNEAAALVNFPGLLDAVNDARVPVDVRLAALGALQGKRGEFGMVFRHNGITDYLTYLKSGIRNRVVGADPLPGRRSPVCIKLVPRRTTKYAKYVQENVREATMHRYVSDMKGVRWQGLLLAPRKYAPRFYFAGNAVDPHGKDVFITAMECIDGKTLDTLVTSRLDAATYVAIEKAVATLWMSGVVHADLHMKNIMMSTGGDVFIIDFGHAVKLPRAKTLEVRHKVLNAIVGEVPSLAELWRSSSTGAGLYDYVDHVVARRGYAHYHPDARLLMYLYNKVTAATRRDVPLLRARAWAV
jgi:hypothetical protein